MKLREYHRMQNTSAIKSLEMVVPAQAAIAITQSAACSQRATAGKVAAPPRPKVL